MCTDSMRLEIVDQLYVEIPRVLVTDQLFVEIPWVLIVLYTHLKSNYLWIWDAKLIICIYRVVIPNLGKLEVLGSLVKFKPWKWM